MTSVAGAAVVLPDRVLAEGTLVIEDDRIVEVRSGAGGDASAQLPGHVVLPGFVDAHVHGVGGVDALGGPGAVRLIAADLPRYGVTAFCPTSVACHPAQLRLMLDDIHEARTTPRPLAARVLPAHLESPFINPDYAGAQPLACLRSPRQALERHAASPSTRAEPPSDRHAFDGDDVLREIARAGRGGVGVVTIAPELDGGLDLIAWLVARGHRVSLGHSGASYEEALAAVAAGARQATHLFNRMTPMKQRAPGLAGAVLQADEVAAEIICDGVHVHPGMVRAAVAAKHPQRVLAITDGTAASGLAPGTRARLGDQTIVAGASSATLEDGTLAGSTATMDGVFRTLVQRMGCSLVDAAAMCATTPARELSLTGQGAIAVGALADLVVLDSSLRVVRTYVGGRLVWSGGPTNVRST